MDWYDPTCYASEILDAKYEKALVDDVIDQLDHLSTQQKNDLKNVLNEHTKLFDGTLRAAETLISKILRLVLQNVNILQNIFILASRFSSYMHEFFHALS